jgi:hypothetical protein
MAAIERASTRGATFGTRRWAASMHSNFHLCEALKAP